MAIDLIRPPPRPAHEKLINKVLLRKLDAARAKESYNQRGLVWGPAGLVHAKDWSL